MTRSRRGRLPRDFGLLAGAQACSSLGSEASRISIPLLVLSMPGDTAAKAGLAATCFLAGQLLARLPGGYLADHANRRFILIAADAARMGLMAGLGLSVLVGHASLPLVIAISAAQGVMDVVFAPAEVGALKRIVAPDEIGRAMTTYEIRDYAVILTGPAVGGLMFQLSPWLPFIFDALTYAISLTLILGIQTKLAVSESEGNAPTLLRSADFLLGFRWLWREPFLRDSVISACLLNFAMSGAFYALVAVTHESGVATSKIGLTLTVASLFGLLGALLSPVSLRRVPDRVLLLGWGWSAALGMGLAILAPTSSPLLLGMALGITYLLAPASSAIEKGYRIVATHPQSQGRIDAAATLLATVASPLGPVACGLVIDTFGRGAGLTIPFISACIAAAFRTQSKAYRGYTTLSTSSGSH